MEKGQVVITGGAGYIGSHTAVALVEAGFHPVLIDNFSNSEPQVIQRIEKIVGKEVECHEVDCTSQEELIRVFQKTQESGPIIGVVHFAAFKAVGESMQKPLDYYQNNVGSTIALLRCMEVTGVKNLVFSSSCTVYGQPASIPVDESAPMLPAESPYGYTKQVCEQMIQDVLQSGQPLASALLRYFNPIGAHPSGLIGELPIGHPNNLIPYLTQATAELRDPLIVFGNDYDTPDGTCIRDYIHVMDLARAHVLALQWLSGQPAVCEAFNLGTGQGSSVMEVIQSFERSNGIKVPHQMGPRRPGDVMAIYADASKAERLLQWRCELNLDTALKDAWNWQKTLTN